MKLGISSYTFGWAVGVRGSEPPRPLDEQGLLEKASELGVDLMQVGDNMPLIELGNERIDHLAAMGRQRGVEIEVGARRLTRENMSAHVAIARKLNARLIRFVVDDAGFHPNSDEIINVLRDAIPELQASSTTLGIENHDRFAARTLAKILEEVGSDRVGICLDTANSLGAGEGIAEVVGILAPWTVNLHIKDFAIERLPYLMGFTVTGRPAGAGMLNLKALLAELRPFDRCRTAVLELWTPPEDNIESTIAKEHAWAVQSLDYLKGFFEDELPRTSASVQNLTCNP